MNVDKAKIKIAIHTRVGSFTDKWIEYCKLNNIPYKLVNCFKNDILQKMNDCQGLMWHWAHSDYKAINFARQLTYSFELIGKKVFPDSKTCWHFDDKVGQKYLLEAIGAPLVKSYVFYKKDDALKWTEETSYPKVFKLRGGAGSLNVKLVQSKIQAFSLIDKAFTKGFQPFDSKTKVKDRWGKLKQNRNKSSLFALIRGIVLYLIPSLDTNYKYLSFDKGYVYFQDFIPDNNHDIRVVIIGERAFAIKRMVREKDFKASGSGNIIYNKENIPLHCIKTAFKLNEKLKTQCTAYDFVFLEEEIKLLEISYGFKSSGYLSCPGFWDKELNWHEGKFTPEWFMIEDFLNSIVKS